MRYQGATGAYNGQSVYRRVDRGGMKGGEAKMAARNRAGRAIHDMKVSSTKTTSSGNMALRQGAPAAWPSR